MFTGIELLAKVESIDSKFVSGPPWNGKEETVIKCGYTRKNAAGILVPRYIEFHEAYEDARIFCELFEKELRESIEDPQRLFAAFSCVRDQTFFLDELVQQIRMLGINYILELEDEIMQEE